MPELTRTLVSRLRFLFGNRRRSKRRLARLPFSVTPSDRRLSANGSGPAPSIEGVTRDLSKTGMGLIVPAIRIGEHYLVGETRRLEVTLELPVESIKIEVVPVRYEALEEHESDIGYVIGAQIINISDADRIRYEEYLHRLLHLAPLD